MRLALLPLALLLAIAILFVADMLLNKGAVIAHRTLDWNPECGGMCHRNFARPSPKKPT